MATKADENKAQKRLAAYPHGGVKVFELERASYRDDGKPLYKAYIAAAKPPWLVRLLRRSYGGC